MKKGDAKRQAILETAYRLFRDMGFDQTSMSEITAQVGGSKATLYSHFASKEELFAECMTAAIDQCFENTLSSLDNARGDTETVLRDFGVSFLRFVASSDMIAVRRLMISESSRLGIGKLFLGKINALRDRIAVFLATGMDSGALRRDDPILAANQLRGLLEAEIVEPLLLQEEPQPGDTERTRSAQRAIDAFLRAYAP
ncbi:TetR/AcrR family transcriptional regulator [Paludibacterium yongneupense]|uniref:TetR/AcrR family transcriptional regulator n=1 Tax=Paludibacterium yongneupense TaxID=400061 RepID=UPI00041BBD7A|nr:TetR/AcrR family transcriptional regulator [Paludibacterium yongneupense]